MPCVVLTPPITTFTAFSCIFLHCPAIAPFKSVESLSSLNAAPSAVSSSLLYKHFNKLCWPFFLSGHDIFPSSYTQSATLRRACHSPSSCNKAQNTPLLFNACLKCTLVPIFFYFALAVNMPPMAPRYDNVYPQVAYNAALTRRVWGPTLRVATQLPSLQP